MILPYTDYCSMSWGSCAKIHRDKIQKLQNKYARMILNEGYYTPQRSLLLRLNWQSVEERIEYQYRVSVFKIQNYLTPTYFESLICKRTVKYRTRYSTKCPLQLPRPRTEYKINSFALCWSQVVQHTPRDILKCVQALVSFQNCVNLQILT